MLSLIDLQDGNEATLLYGSDELSGRVNKHLMFKHVPSNKLFSLVHKNYASYENQTIKHCIWNVLQHHNHTIL